LLGKRKYFSFEFGQDPLGGIRGCFVLISDVLALATSCAVFFWIFPCISRRIFVVQTLSFVFFFVTATPRAL